LDEKAVRAKHQEDMAIMRQKMEVAQKVGSWKTWMVGGALKSSELYRDSGFSMIWRCQQRLQT
jgi:hypothetical protein